MQLISSWGSSGSGKSTVALALATALAKHGHDVLILAADGKTPGLPVLLPTLTSLSGNNSLGNLFSDRELTEAQLKDRLIQHPKSSHIYAMGYTSGETAALSYAPPTREAAIGLFQLLSQTPFEYVIVDCDSNPVYDAVTLAALEHARAGLMILTPDVKGYEYRKAQLGWLGNSDAFHIDQFIRIANPVFPGTPIKDAETLFGGFDFELPYAAQVMDKLVAGELLTGFNSSAALEFERKIRLLMEKLQEVSHESDTKSA